MPIQSHKSNSPQCEVSKMKSLKGQSGIPTQFPTQTPKTAEEQIPHYKARGHERCNEEEESVWVIASFKSLVTASSWLRQTTGVPVAGSSPGTNHSNLPWRGGKCRKFIPLKSESSIQQNGTESNNLQLARKKLMTECYEDWKRGK